MNQSEYDRKRMEELKIREQRLRYWREKSIYEERLRENRRKQEEAEKAIVPVIQKSWTFEEFAAIIKRTFKPVMKYFKIIPLLLLLPIIGSSCSVQYAKGGAEGFVYLDSQIGGYHETQDLKMDKNGFGFSKRITDDEASLKDVGQAVVSYTGIVQAAKVATAKLTEDTAQQSIKTTGATDQAGIAADVEKAQIEADLAKALAEEEAAAQVIPIVTP